MDDYIDIDDVLLALEDIKNRTPKIIEKTEEMASRKNKYSYETRQEQFRRVWGYLELEIGVLEKTITELHDDIEIVTRSRKERR